MFYGVSGIHMEVFEYAAELELCWELVEYWWYGCYAVAGDCVSVCLHMGTSSREGEGASTAPEQKCPEVQHECTVSDFI